jgi:hypothetical protein
VLKQKAMDKKVTNKIRKSKTKEREEKRFNKVQHMITQEERIAQKSIEKKIELCSTSHG